MYETFILVTGTHSTVMAAYMYFIVLTVTIHRGKSYYKMKFKILTMTEVVEKKINEMVSEWLLFNSKMSIFLSATSWREQAVFSYRWCLLCIRTKYSAWFLKW